jgi:hypothetical protein
MNTNEEMQLQALARELPFACTLDGVIDLWAPEPANDEDEGIARGEAYAELTISLCKSYGSPALLAMVLADIVKARCVGPVESGFLIKVAESARVGALS